MSDTKKDKEIQIENPKQVKKRHKKIDYWKIFLICITIILAVGLVFGNGIYRDKLTKAHESRVSSLELIEKSNQNFDHLKETHESYIASFEQKSQELENLKEELEGIKDKDDLLQRDIGLYIKTTHPKVPKVVAISIAENTVSISKKYNISPELTMGIIKVESAFNPMAVGPKTKYGHARGLMQVMPEWAPKLKVNGKKVKSPYSFHNIDVGIDCGIQVFLIHLKEGKGDISTGLYKYVNNDKTYVGKVYEAMGKFVAFRSTINEENQNVETDIETNGEKKVKAKKGEKIETKG